MKAVSKLVLAATLATAVPGARALAACDDDRRTAAPVVLPAPAPYAAAAAYSVPVRHESWREQEAREIRRELRALEDERAAFLQRFGWNARKVAKFERHYAARRAELDRRWGELRYYAWR